MTLPIDPQIYLVANPAIKRFYTACLSVLSFYPILIKFENRDELLRPFEKAGLGEFSLLPYGNKLRKTPKGEEYAFSFEDYKHLYFAVDFYCRMDLSSFGEGIGKRLLRRVGGNRNEGSIMKKRRENLRLAQGFLSYCDGIMKDNPEWPKAMEVLKTLKVVEFPSKFWESGELPL